ncbi:MAG: hypothetical protein F4073_08170 [Rhodobacteraceae bacterium]|nr:hypothetical protein [Paracoccaceae bacterium]MYF45612.1 hypothetical protein [Paracoccaceae bacterium]MYI91914.1 hypothetical protein [Paracoccaceae bacterium]
MKRFITITSALALVGSVSYAMEEDKMDEMMEAEAPSVTMTGSAELGFKSVDDDDDSTEDFKIIRMYKVAFGSSGTTDGGLVFGAGISIIDEHGDPGDTKSVGGSNVYIGGADGSWKLKLGGNDPGALVAGGIGVADDRLDRGNALIGLEGSFGDTSYRLTMADPQNDENDWSIGAKHSLGDFSVGIGMDSMDGLALSVGTELQGVGLTAYYSTSEATNVNLEKDYKQPSSLAAPTGHASDNNKDAINEAYSKYMASFETLGKQEWKGLGLKASVSAGEGAKISFGYSTSKMEQMENMPDAVDRVIIDTETEATGDAATAVAFNVSSDGIAENTEVAYAVATSYALRSEAAENWNGTAKTSLIEIDFEYDLGGDAKLIAGIDKKTVETLELTATSHKATDDGFEFSTEAGTDNEVVTYSTSVSEKDTTELSLKLAFSF